MKNNCYMNYTGSKGKFYDKIKHLFPESHVKCLDVFTGGNSLGSMLPDHWDLTFNDKCSQVIEVHKVFDVRSYKGVTSFDNIRESAVKVVSSRSINSKDNYIKQVDMYNTFSNPLDLYSLICSSFSNQIRFNSKGEWNMPFGKRYFNPSMQKKLRSWMERIYNKESITWSSESFESLMFQDYDFIIADPPYLKTTASYNEQGGWSEEKTILLLDKLEMVANQGKKFILFEEKYSKGIKNDLICKFASKYNEIQLGDSSSGSNYQRKGGYTEEVCIYN